MTKRDLKYGLLIVVIIAAWIGNEIYRRKLLEREIITAPVLKENEKQKIIIDTNKRTVTTVKRGPIGKGKDKKDGNTQVVKRTDGARKVVITENQDGSIRVDTINRGFVFEPGLALYFSDQARLGLDVQVAYYKRWGVLLGAGVNMGDEPRTVRAHVGVNYALPLSFIDNTTVFAGIDHRKDAAVGLRIRF